MWVLKDFTAGSLPIGFSGVVQNALFVGHLFVFVYAFLKCVLPELLPLRTCHGIAISLLLGRSPKERSGFGVFPWENAGGRGGGCSHYDADQIALICKVNLNEVFSFF